MCICYFNISVRIFVLVGLISVNSAMRKDSPPNMINVAEPQIATPEIAEKTSMKFPELSIRAGDQNCVNNNECFFTSDTCVRNKYNIGRCKCGDSKPCSGDRKMCSAGSCDAQYFLKGAKELCTAGEIINDAKTCQSVAYDMNLRYTTEEEPQWLKGCYKYLGGSGQQIFWNPKGQTQKGDSNAAPICKIDACTTDDDCPSQLPFCNNKVCGYQGFQGACRNDDDEFADIFPCVTLNSLSECKAKCDQESGCLNVSWFANTCCGMSKATHTTPETGWMCYTKDR